MKSNLKLAEAWFRKAESDITTVEILLELGGPYDAASFHAQQAAEKYLKGFLAFHGITNIPKTHSLVALHGLCSSCDESLEIEVNLLAELTAYAVDCRYDLDFFPDEAVAAEALSSARRVRTAVSELISEPE